MQNEKVNAKSNRSGGNFNIINHRFNGNLD